MNQNINSKYKLMCARAKELQKGYYPAVGDYIIAKASYDAEWNKDCSEDVPCEQCIEDDNVYVIDNKFDYAESVGGTYWFFNSMLCSKDGGNLANDTCCSIISKNGHKNKWEQYDNYPLKDFLWIPKLDQLITLLTVPKFYEYFMKSKGCIDSFDNDFEINTLMYLMKEKYNKSWNDEMNQWQ